MLQRIRRDSPAGDLSDLADDEIDEVLGLRMGADDYIKKPFSQRLLIERIALLRRQDMAVDDGALAGEPMLARPVDVGWCRHMYLGQPRGGPHGDRVFDPKSLATRPGHVKNRDQLMDAAYGDWFTWMIAPSIATSSASGANFVSTALTRSKPCRIGYRYRESAAEAG